MTMIYAFIGFCLVLAMIQPVLNLLDNNDGVKKLINKYFE